MPKKKKAKKKPNRIYKQTTTKRKTSAIDNIKTGSKPYNVKMNKSNTSRKIGTLYTTDSSKFT